MEHPVKQKPIYRIWKKDSNSYHSIINSGKSVWAQPNHVLKTCDWLVKHRKSDIEIHILDINDGNRKVSLKEFRVLMVTENPVTKSEVSKRI